MSIVSINNVTKKFKSAIALDNINLTLEENKIYGLLGRNGAGKSTLLNLISNRLFPTCGSIYVDGDSVVENDSALTKIYCMSDASIYDEDFKVKDVFGFTKDFYPNYDVNYEAELVKKFDINTNKKIKELSTGYNSIFKIIIALSASTPITLLDEPVLGLDANHRELFYKELLKTYSANPRTFVLSTHIIEEIADIIELAVIIKNGKILIHDEVENIKKMGYTASGKTDDVDSFINGKNVISSEVLGGLKSAVILGEKPLDTPKGIDLGTMQLQQLFIHLTNA